MAELKLHQELFDYDSEIRRIHPVFCGVDEAGRGPLAGDVYAAAVILSDKTLIKGLNDSKKISEKNREKLFDIIIENADDFCIASASAEEIDRINILQAAMLAMERAVAGLKKAPEFALIDGNRCPALPCTSEFLVKGDAKSISIAAASILAKVSRDRYMLEADKKYPEYKFAQHKGYGTKLHYEMLAEFGLCPEHRRTFLKKILGDGNDR